MPRNRLVDELLISGRVYALSVEEGVEAEEENVSHRDDIPGAGLRLHEDSDFLQMTDDEVIAMVNDLSVELVAQVLESVLLVRDELIIADEIITLGERYEAGEQDWEV